MRTGIIVAQTNDPCYQQYEVVPATPLVTSEVLREETDLWMDVKQGMSLALQEMRVDKVVPLKPPKKSESALIRKRMAAKEREKAPTPITEEKETDSLSTSTSQQMSVENTQM